MNAPGAADAIALTPASRATSLSISEAAAASSVSRETAARRAQVVAVANQKGGVGKTTTATNTATYLALGGLRVLLVDLDPQGNATTGLGLDRRRATSLYEVLIGASDPWSAVVPTAVPGLEVVPSTVELAGAEVELTTTSAREYRLRDALSTMKRQYDVVFIDCPPSLGLLTVNAFAAADQLLVPLQCEYYALEALGQLVQNVDLVRRGLNATLVVGGILLTMYDARTRLAEQVVEDVRKHFGDTVLNTVVPRSVRLSEAPGFGQPIALYDPLSRGGIAYQDVAREMALRLGLEPRAAREAS